MSSAAGFFSAITEAIASAAAATPYLLKSPLSKMRTFAIGPSVIDFASASPSLTPERTSAVTSPTRAPYVASS